MKTILLLGSSGTGKTSVGRALVDLMSVELERENSPAGSPVEGGFVELEEFFAQQVGQTFKQALELWDSPKLQLALREVALDLLQSPTPYGVISLTPSAPTDPKIAAAIHAFQPRLFIVELRAAVDVLGRRLGLNAPRPLGLVNLELPGPYTLFRQFNETLHQTYQQFSPMVVDTSAITATQAAVQVLAATR